MTVNDIDTSGFLVDPKKEDFVKDMLILSPVFNFRIDRVNHRKSLLYIALMYDKSSHFRRDIKSFQQRKYQCAVAVGFSMDENGMLREKAVEDTLVGENEDFNKAVVQYCVLQYDIDYIKLVVYEMALHKAFASGLKKMDDKDKKYIDDLSATVGELTDKVFGGEETINARKALYEGTTRTRLRLRPEDIAEDFKINGLSDLSPYGKDYKIESLKFVGDKQPDLELDDLQI